MAMNDLKNSIADQAFAFLSLTDSDSPASPAMTRDDILEVLDSLEVLKVLEILDNYNLSSKNPNAAHDILFLGLGIGLNIGVRYGIMMALNITEKIADETEWNNDKLSYDNYYSNSSNKDTE